MTTRLLRNSFSRPSISTRALPEAIKASLTLKAKRPILTVKASPKYWVQPRHWGAIALDGTDAEARSQLAHALRRRGDYAGGLAETERALTLSPNLADAHAIKGSILIFSGRLTEGVE